MGFVQIKGVGRDRLGRVEPAFLSAITIALPPSTCTARREAGRHPLAAVVFAARPANCWLLFSLRPVPGGESAGCVCLQCLVPQAVCLLCHAIPLPSTTFLPPFKFVCPRSFCFALSIPCAPGSPSVKPSCLQAARLSRRQQQRGSAVAARAPSCVHHTVTGAARLPVGSRNMGTAFEQPMRRCPLPIKGGGLGLHLGSQPSSPHLHFMSQRLRVSSLAPS